MASPFGKLRVLFVLLAVATVAPASVINIHKWRLGEEIGGVPGDYYTNGFSENFNGNPHWIDLWGQGYLGPSTVPGSTVAAVDPRLRMAEIPAPRFTDLTDNFGIEFWVKPTGNFFSQITATIVSNGNWAIERQAGFWQLRFNDGNGSMISRWLFGTVTANQWVNFAFVRQNGTNTVYVNGFAYTSSNVLIDAGLGNSAPLATLPTFRGSVGFEGTFLNRPAQYFSGSLDELRSFDATDFTTDDLYINQAQVPEPGPILTTVSGLVALVHLRRRRRGAARLS